MNIQVTELADGDSETSQPFFTASRMNVINARSLWHVD